MEAKKQEVPSPYGEDDLTTQVRPTMTPANTYKSAKRSESDSESDYSGGSSISEAPAATPPGQLEPTTMSADEPQDIVQQAKPASPPLEDSRTRQQKKKVAHFDDRLLEDDAAIRRIATDPSHLHSISPSNRYKQKTTTQSRPRAWSGTGLELHATSPTQQEQEDDDNAEDNHAHQRRAIEHFYVSNRGHVKERAQNDSEFDADDDNDGRSLVSIGTASLNGDDNDMVPDVPEDIDSRLQPPLRQANPRTDSLEVYASEVPDVEATDPRHVQQDELSTESDDESSVDAPFAYLQVPGAFDANKAASKGTLYGLPNITEESLRSREDHVAADAADEDDASSGETFPAYREPRGSSSIDLDALELVRRPSETQSAPAPSDRRGRRMTKAEVHPRHSSSLTEFCRMKGRVRRTSCLSTKSSPALPAMTAISVRTAESPRINTVYDNPKSRYMSLPPPKVPIRTAHTVHSDLGLYKMVWEDVPGSSSGDSSGTMLEQPRALDSHDANRLVAPIPMMEKVSSKLKVWT